MDNPFRPKSNVDRLYIPRQVGGRGFQCVKRNNELDKFIIRELCKRVHRAFAYSCEIYGY